MTILTGDISSPAAPNEPLSKPRLGTTYLGMAALADLLLAAERLTPENITMRGWGAFLKRLMDVFVSGALLILTSPLMALIAICIKLGSDGPAIFRQPRVGRNGRPFTILKFRTMGHNACNRKIDELSLDSHKSKNDSRITPLGKFLRAHSLDELPQLWNVLMGDMSLVGPRPEVFWVFDCHYEPWQRARVLVPPGITGWWQIHGRSDRPLHENTEDDIFYIVNWSLWLDVKILFRTFGAVFHRRGAF
jgi:lipopolysaccharide/colanic/teichoic acid biosynthesis glycosyltransferase